ncbi:hypothetical protein GCM10023081_20070 [Arthrobacter ginkgonis]|uniref:General stress protein CsbD n=1 Tax=Arthrobacter ginkgonis TaxID=1630594 RepID=A0ABP7C9K9_9MICC
MNDNTISGWDKGKNEAHKRFGKREKLSTPADTNAPEQPSETHTGPAAGIAEARRRFGKPRK